MLKRFPNVLLSLSLRLGDLTQSISFPRRGTRNPRGSFSNRPLKRDDTFSVLERGVGVPARVVGDGLFVRWPDGKEAKAKIIRRSPTTPTLLENHLRPRIGVFSAVAARTGSKYSRTNAILPRAARRNTT